MNIPVQDPRPSTNGPLHIPVYHQSFHPTGDVSLHDDPDEVQDAPEGNWFVEEPGIGLGGDICQGIMARTDFWLMDPYPSRQTEQTRVISRFSCSTLKQWTWVEGDSTAKLRHSGNTSVWTLKT